MNHIDRVIVNLTGNDATLKDLVGLRVFPVGDVRQSVKLPFIIYVSDNEPTVDKDGDITTHQGKFELAIYSDRVKDSEQVAQRLDTVFQNFQGTVSGVQVDDIQALGSFPGEFNKKLELFEQRLEYNYALQVFS